MSLSGLLLRGTEHIMPFKCLTLLSGKIAEAKLGFLSQFLICLPISSLGRVGEGLFFYAWNQFNTVYSQGFRV